MEKKKNKTPTHNQNAQNNPAPKNPETITQVLASVFLVPR